MGYPSNAITTTSIGYPNAPANATLQPITVGDLDTSSQYCYQGEQKGIAGRAHRSCVCPINNYHVGNGEQPTHSAHTHVTLTTHTSTHTHPSFNLLACVVDVTAGTGPTCGGIVTFQTPTVQTNPPTNIGTCCSSAWPLAWGCLLAHVMVCSLECLLVYSRPSPSLYQTYHRLQQRVDAQRAIQRLPSGGQSGRFLQVRGVQHVQLVPDGHSQPEHPEHPGQRQHPVRGGDGAVC